MKHLHSRSSKRASKLNNFSCMMSLLKYDHPSSVSFVASWDTSRHGAPKRPRMVYNSSKGKPRLCSATSARLKCSARTKKHIEKATKTHSSWAGVVSHATVEKTQGLEKRMAALEEKTGIGTNGNKCAKKKRKHLPQLRLLLEDRNVSRSVRRLLSAMVMNLKTLCPKNNESVYAYYFA
mmetsp:Transcript_23103/g.40868  ORF Transcript_23103/g.40868 Transcript_23103/m.40868 type:complete len:179 (+) Transcript_23103:811-1347(+)